MKKYLSAIFKSAVILFALIGVFFSAVFVGMKFGFFNVQGTIAERNAFFLNNQANADKVGVLPCLNGKPTCAWNETPEWSVVHDGLIKDAAVLNRVSTETGIPARLIASVVIPEQTRFFTSNREVFKSYFEPLKVLGTMSQFSLGVSGIKEGTARQIEAQADATSSALLAYNPNVDRNKERYNRLTNAKDHYYSYLYTALFIKEVEMEWQKAGFDISNRPEIIATIFNLGFNGSKPNPNPQVGGAIITTGGKPYAFGELGGLFYYSTELEDVLKK